MTPQELKASILQLAIQGKLVEQRPEEGTGAELLEKILRDGTHKTTGTHGTKSRAAHRTSSVPSVLSVPSVSSVPFVPPIPDDEKPFDIPESWEWVRLEEVISLLSGRDLEPSEYSATPKKYPYMTGASNFANGNLLVNRWTDRPVTISHMGDLLITCKGTVGAMAFNAIGDIHIARQIMAISSESIDLHYVKVFLAASVQALKAAANSMIPGIDRKTMLLRPIPLPPLAEQKRIVAKIEELLPYIDRYEKAWSKLEDFNKRFPDDMQKSLLQMAIQGKLVDQRPEEGTGEELLEKILRDGTHKATGKHRTKSRAAHRASSVSSVPSVPSVSSVPFVPPIPDDEKPFDIPESWAWVRLSDLMTTISTGPFGSMLHKADYIENGIPLVNPANIIGGKIVPSQKMMVSKETRERLSGYILHEGMIVMGRRGEMGRCAVVSWKEEGWLCGTGSFFLEPNKNIFVEYISRLFSTPYAKLYLGGESVGTTMSNLNHTILRNMPIPLPPLAEQKRIVAKLEELLPLCERLK